MQQAISQTSAQLWDSLLRADTDAAARLIADNAVFVHMGATLNKTEELAAIGNIIILKQRDLHEQSIKMFGNTAVLLNKITLTAQVNGEIVTNPFVVTETYIAHGETWQLAAMAYTRIIY